jgi:hypothetical protein
MSSSEGRILLTEICPGRPVEYIVMASFGGAVELWPPRLGGRWGVAAGVGFVRTSRDAAADLGGSQHALATSTDLWPITLGAAARWRLGGRWTGLAEAGGALVAIRSAVSFDGSSGEEWGRALGVRGSAGAALELPSWRARVRLEALLGWQEDAGMRSFRGSLGTVGIAVGMSHDAF